MLFLMQPQSPRRTPVSEGLALTTLAAQIAPVACGADGAEVRVYPLRSACVVRDRGRTTYRTHDEEDALGVASAAAAINAVLRGE